MPELDRLTVLEGGAGSLVEFYEWVKDALNGDVLVYHTGDLAFDRQVTVEPDAPDAASRELKISALNAVAEAVRRSAKAREVSLTQQRLKPGVYQYRATRIRQGHERLVLERFSRVEPVFA